MDGVEDDGLGDFVGFECLCDWELIVDGIEDVEIPVEKLNLSAISSREGKNAKLPPLRLREAEKYKVQKRKC